MNKVLSLSIAIVTLSGCSTYNGYIDKLYGSSDAVSINPDDNQDNPDGDAIPKEDPTASIKLEYKADTHEIDAEIITNWNGVPQGSIYLTWSAPEETSCYSTSFPITKYNDDQDYTKDSQSVLDDNKVCKGKWTAIVTDKSDDSELAKETITIE